MEQQQQPIYHFTIYNIFVRTTQISQYQKKRLANSVFLMATGWLLVPTALASHCMTARWLAAATRQQENPKMPFLPQPSLLTRALDQPTVCWTAYSGAWSNINLQSAELCVNKSLV